MNEEKRLRELLEAGFLQEEEFQERITQLARSRSRSPGVMVPTSPVPEAHAVAIASAALRPVVYDVKPPPPPAGEDWKKRRSIRVDMEVEREALQKFVFPELRAMCSSRNVTFTEIDFRWGITEEDSAGGKVINLCLKEIDSCRPYLIGLLGKRYGWSKKSSAYEDRKLSESFSQAMVEYPWVESYQDRSITELEMLYGALFYPPQATGAAFYFRDPSFVQELGRSIEQESPAAAPMVEDLKWRIRQSGLPVKEFKTPEDLSRAVLADFRSFIDRDFPVLEMPVDSPERFQQLHESFAERRSHVFVGRPEYFDALEKHLRGSSRSPLFVTGPSGSGKTSLLASWVTELRKKKPENVELVASFGELSEPALWKTIRHIISLLKSMFKIETEIRGDPLSIVHDLLHWLRDAVRSLPPGGKLVIVLDGLDYLEEKAHSLLWLPEALPPQVRLFVSAPEGSSIVRVLSARKVERLTLEPLTNVEKRRLIAEYLAMYGKKLNDSQISMLAADSHTSLPVFLCTVLEQVRVHGSFSDLSSNISFYLECSDTRDLFEKILASWERDYDAQLVTTTMSLIFASRSGLLEAELVDVMKIMNALTWARFFGAARELLTDKQGLLDFSHLYLRRAVLQRYGLQDAAKKASFSAMLVSFFKGQKLNQRKLAEYPHHLEIVGAKDLMREFLMDIDVFISLYTESQKLEFLHFTKSSGDKASIAACYRQAVKGRPRTADLRSLLTRLAAFHSDIGDIQNAMALVTEALAVTRELSKGAESWDVADTMHELGLLLVQGGKMSEAAAMARETYDMRIRVKSGRLHIAESLWLLALVAKKQGSYAEAIKLYTEAHEITEKKLGHAHPSVAVSFMTIADVYRKQANYAQAQELYERALDIATAVYGESAFHPQIAEILHSIGRIDEKKGLYPQARKRFERAIEIISSVYGEEHTTYAEVALSLAHVLRKTAEFDRALSLYHRSLAINQRAYGAIHPEVAECLNAIGLIHFTKGELDEAESVFRRAIATLESIFGPEHVNLARFTSNLADVLAGKAKYDDAVGLYKRALAINEKSLGAEHPETAECLSSLGFILKKRGQFAEAQAMYERALAIVEKAFGSEHYKVAILLQNIGVTCRKLGKLDESWARYSRALELNQRLLGLDHPTLGDNYNGLGLVERKRGNLDESADFHRRALELFESRLGRDHAKVALTLNYLAEVYRKQGRFSFLDGTEALYLRAMAINRKVYGSEHPEIAENLNGLAQLYKAQFNFDKAEEYFLQAIGMSEKLLGKGNPHVRNRYENLADLYERQGSVRKAEETRKVIASLPTAAGGQE